MLEGDGQAAAEEASRRFPTLSAVEHFHDADRTLGRAVAAPLGAGKVAWDFYLIYPRGSHWGIEPPAPSAWFHQLREEAWAGADRFRWGEALGPDLRRALDESLKP